MLQDLVGALDAQNLSVPFRNLKFPYISDVAISGGVLLLGWESEARHEGIAEGCMQRPMDGALFRISDPESVSWSPNTMVQGAGSLTAKQLIDGGARKGGCLVPSRAQVGLLQAQRAAQSGCKRKHPGAVKSRRPCLWMFGGGGAVRRRPDVGPIDSFARNVGRLAIARLRATVIRPTHY